MAGSLNTTTTGTTSTATSSLALTLAAATAAGDICLVNVATGNGGTTVSSISGLGATWSRLQTDANMGPNVELWVGTGCTASNTAITVTLSGTPAFPAYGWASCWSGISPALVASSATGYPGTGGLHFKAPAKQAGATGQLIVDLFTWGNAGAISSVTDTPDTFTYAVNEYNPAAQSHVTRYRVTAETGTDEDTQLNMDRDDIFGPAYGVLLGTPPQIPGTKAVVVRQAVSRASFW